MRNPSVLAEIHGEAHPTPLSVAPGSGASTLILRDCFELFRSNVTGFAKLSIETSNDLFEMDPRVTEEEVYEFKSKRSGWVTKFDAVLRELFERRLAGQRRKGRRPDPLQSFDSLRVMNDSDTSRQNALEKVARRLEAAAKQELDALDYRISVLFDGESIRDADNPFSPAYLLDAIGMTSRALYAEARIWRPLMERLVGDFVPAINNIYIKLNRILTERSVLPAVGATLRARSNLRPADDRQLLPLFSRLLNDIHPALQAWRTLDKAAASAASYQLAPLAANPYVGATAKVPRRSTAAAAGDFPRLDAMMATGTVSAVLETLDYWQRADPMTEHLRTSAPAGIDAGVTPVNRIPWIHAAIASQVKEESGRAAIDVVGFLFDYIFSDPSLPPRFRMIFGGLQIPILKVALSDQSFFVDEKQPTRRLIDALGGAAIGADDDDGYGDEFLRVAKSIVDTIRGEFVLDTSMFERACLTLKRFTDDWQKRSSLAMQEHVDAGLAGELRDAHRSQVRALIRDKLAGVDVALDVRGFIGTVWADYLTLAREGGTDSDAYIDAVQTMEDLLWSITAKERTGQKAKLAKMIPSLVSSLRAGGAAVQVAEEKMKRFLGALYELHIAAIKPASTRTVTPASYEEPSLLANKEIGNLYDFVADLIPGTWLAFDENGVCVRLMLSWISPWRATYIFMSRSGSKIMVVTPEELAWEMSTGKVALVVEPVPLFDRAVSVTLEYLAGQNAKRDTKAM